MNIEFKTFTPQQLYLILSFMDMYIVLSTHNGLPMGSPIFLPPNPNYLVKAQHRRTKELLHVF
jgi:hypothetical protein